MTIDSIVLLIFINCLVLGNVFNAFSPIQAVRLFCSPLEALIISLLNVVKNEKYKTGKLPRCLCSNRDYLCFIFSSFLATKFREFLTILQCPNIYVLSVLGHILIRPLFILADFLKIVII